MSFLRLFTRARRERELDEEIQAHLAMAARDRVERGADPRAAELAARREFGNRTLVQETTRDMWGGNALRELWQDARYALRGMRRSPGFTAVAVASLALGIGANNAIFSLVETVMLRMLPVSHPEQLVELLQKYPGEPRGLMPWSWRSYEHIRTHNHVFSGLFGTSIDNRARLEIEGAEPLTGIRESVTGNYFPELGVKPALGRLIGPRDNPQRPEGSVAVVSWSLWNRLFHGDPGVLGKRIRVVDLPATIVGVAPRSFVGLRVEAETDVWLPQAPQQNGLTLLARLKPAATLQQARAEMPVLYRFTIEERAAGSQDPQMRRLSVQVEPAGNGLATVRDRYGKPLSVLMAVVGLLLLLTCVNIASMLLARGAGREREMALRTSLGASRGRLLRQALTESLMLSAAGAALGAAVAWFGTGALLRIIASGREHERVYLRVQPDFHMLLFAAGIALLAGLLFGAAPAWMAFRTAPASALRQAGGAGETRVRRLFGKGLVAAQVALSLLLLSSAGLFLANLASLEKADLGFRRDHILLAPLDPASSGYSGARRARAYEDLLARLERIPGVRSATMGGPTPIQGAGASGFANVEGFQESEADRRWISICYVAPQYLETLGTPLLAGRGFTFEDRASRVAIVNRTFARYYFAGRNPIGKRVTLYHVTLVPEPRTYVIVGVAGDANYAEIREPARRGIYLPAFHDGTVSGQILIIRTNIDPQAVAGDVRRAVRDAAPGISVARTTTLAEQIDASIVPERLIALLSGFFGALGAALAGIGLYGLLAYTVARRINEIGIRLALGATAGDVTRMVLRDALATVLGGLILGAPMAIWGRALAVTLIQDLPVPTAVPFALAGAGIVAITFVASYVPARRAARVDPIEALRHE
ncbi:MAG: ABC transporter permease [Acidobacteriia bacterium]|nr:ABC transporter permease [Terriglobia bacterium]